jgi:aspartyl protease
MNSRYRYSGIEPLRRAVAQSYATAMVTLKQDEDGTLPYKPYHDVTVFNKRTGQPVTVPALSDQGNDITLFTEDWAAKLGYDLNEGTPLGVQGVGGSMAKHFVAVEGVMQIAPSLRPVRTTFAFGDTPKNLLGRESILGRYNVLYTPNSVQYTETSSGFDNKSEAMMARMRNPYRVNSGRNFGANWRNRT